MQIRNEELTAEQLRLIDTRMLTKAAQYRSWKSYMIGLNPTILNAPAKDSPPDNRVPVPFARKIVRTLKGYMFKPGYITYSTEGEYITRLKEIFDANDEELLTAEVAKEALSTPESYEVLRVNDSLEPRFYKVAYSKGYPVYDDTLAENVAAFVHYDTLDDELDTEIRTIYYRDRYIVDERRAGAGTWTRIDEVEHPYGDVPIAIYRTNDDLLPIFQAVLPMIDEHDKVISSAYADERERFANSLLVLLDKLVSGTEEEQAETLARMRQNRILQDLGRNDAITRVQDAVMFLHKPSRGADAAEEADRLERLIYDMAMVINPTDDSFGSASGIALRYKLLPMEFLAADIEAYFSRGLQRRIELIGNALSNLGRGAPEPVTIHFRRNLPTDLESLGQTASLLKGILSDRTILEQFPADVVPNVMEELESVQKQREVYAMDEPEPVENGA